MHVERAGWIATALAFASVVVGAGCSGTEPPEEKLDELSEKQEEAESRVVDAEEQLRERKKKVSRQETDLTERRNALEEEQRAVEEAKRELADAKQKLERAEKRLREIQREIAREVSDVALFRHIQKTLLEREELSQVALSVAVREHVVTLEGEVPEQELEEIALRVARSTPGVLEVKDRITVREPQPEPQSKKSPKRDPSHPKEESDRGGDAT